MPTTPAAVEPVPASSDLRGPIAELALSMVGVQYRYGGAHPREGFDCSGLVYYAFTSNGHVVPRTSREQFDAAQKISLDEAASAQSACPGRRSAARRKWARIAKLCMAWRTVCRNILPLSW